MNEINLTRKAKLEVPHVVQLIDSAFFILLRELKKHVRKSVRLLFV